VADENTTRTRKGAPWWVWALGAPLVCCLGSGMYAGYLRLTIDSNPVYVGALKRANASSAARKRLGSPITVTRVDSFSIGMKGTKLMLDVAGPGGTGKLLAYAAGEEPDSLEIIKMKLRVDGSGEIISLDGGRSSADDF
jgi:hypothetical protein